MPTAVKNAESLWHVTKDGVVIPSDKNKRFLPMSAASQSSDTKLAKTPIPANDTFTDEHTKPDRSDVKILVVEDTEANILISRILIESLGYGMDTARNAGEAVRKFQENSYSLVLLDLRMPEKSGYEICKEFLAHEFKTNAPHTPIIALTAYATLSEQKRCKAVGMDDFLSKPIDSEKLVTMLSRHLK